MTRQQYSMAALVAAIVLTFTACKPTEKNYRAAYDAAVGKREADARRQSQDLPEGVTLQSDDTPRKVNLEGRQVMRKFFRLAAADGQPLQRFNIAVSAYKMKTNAMAEAEALRSRGFEATAAVDAPGKWYVIAASCPTAPEAAMALDLWKEKNPQFQYIGLWGEPLLIIQ